MTLTPEGRIAYEQGYQDGSQRWRERCERLSMQLEDFQKRYDYLLNLRTEELLAQPPARIIVDAMSKLGATPPEPTT